MSRASSIRSAVTSVSLAVFVACGSFEDPTLEQTFDPEAADPPPEREPVPFDPNRNHIIGAFDLH